MPVLSHLTCFGMKLLDILPVAPFCEERHREGLYEDAREKYHVGRSTTASENKQIKFSTTVHN